MDCEPSLVCSEEAMTSRISFEQEVAANFLVSVEARRKEKSSPASWPSSFQEHIWYFPAESDPVLRSYVNLKHCLKYSEQGIENREQALTCCRVALRQLQSRPFFVPPKCSFWIEGIDGCSVSVNSTLVRLAFPRFMEHIQQCERPAKIQRQCDSVAAHKKYFLQGVIDFCDQRTLEGLKRYIEEGEVAGQEPFSVYLQLMAVANKTGNTDLRQRAFLWLMSSFSSISPVDFILLAVVFFKKNLDYSPSTEEIDSMIIEENECEDRPIDLGRAYPKIMSTLLSLSEAQRAYLFAFDCFSEEEIEQVQQKWKALGPAFSPEKVHLMLDGKSLIDSISRCAIALGGYIAIANEENIRQLLMLLSDTRVVRWLNEENTRIAFIHPFRPDPGAYKALISILKNPLKVVCSEMLPGGCVLEDIQRFVKE